MSHFSVMVVTPEFPTDEILHDELLPYNEYIKDVNITDDMRKEYLQIPRINPNAKWDSYTVGGRWSGFFKLKDGELGTPNVDIARKMDIDFAAMQLRAELFRGEKYDYVRAIIEPYIGGFVKWKTALETYTGDDINAVRNFYNNQPLFFALRESDDEELSWVRDPTEYFVDRDTFITAVRRYAISTFAFLRDKQWYERGRMGWFGSVFDEKCDWLETFEKLLNDVPDEYYLTVVDCHI